MFSRAPNYWNIQDTLRGMSLQPISYDHKEIQEAKEGNIGRKNELREKKKVSGTKFSNA